MPEKEKDQEKSLKKEYLKLCKDFGEKNFPLNNRGILETVQSHWSMADEFARRLIKLCVKYDN